MTLSPSAAVQTDDSYVEYLTAALVGDARRAESEASRRISQGWTYEDICLRLVQPTMHEVGRMWQRKKISVAQEHLATAISQSVLARLFQMGPAPETRGTLVACCPEGEFHGLGLRVAADFALRSGWTVDFLGTNVPGSDLFHFIENRQPTAVLVSTSVPISLPQTERLLRGLESWGDRPLLIVGGNAYGGRPEAALNIGADAFASDAAVLDGVLDEYIS